MIPRKSPTDSDLFDLDCTDAMRASENVSSITSITATPAGLTLGTPVHDGKRVQCRISGGTAGVTYKVSLVWVSDLGNTYEDAMPLVVRGV